MGKVKFLIGRIFNIDFKNFFTVINDVQQRSGKSKIAIFFDCVYCGLVYQAGYLYYKYFEMYDATRAQRKTFVTRGKNNEFIKRNNDPSYQHYFEDKRKFNEKFKDFVKRQWLFIDGNNQVEFQEFIKDKKEIIAKPLDGSHGDGIAKVASKDADYDDLLARRLVLIEEVVQQHETMLKLNPSSVNTVRFITLYAQGEAYIIMAYQRIGIGRVVDNFNGGGMVTLVDIDKGVLIYPGRDKAENIYQQHPVTGTKIVGFKLPLFEEAKEMVKKAAAVVPKVGLVGWDVGLTPNGPLIIEGNYYPGHDIYNLPKQRDENGCGVLPLFYERTNNLI